MSARERDLVRWLAQAEAPHPSLHLGVGDDMAILRCRGSHVLATCDMLLDGVHFDSREHSMDLIGRKAACCSLSDCAAMAVNPLAAVVSIAVPDETPYDEVRGLMRAIAAACSEHRCVVAGGDTNSWPGKLAVDVTVLAEPFPGVAPVRRDGARPGDKVYVTGKLGGSPLGGHLTFVPRIREARTLAEELGPRLHAMIDISDGTAIDADRVAEASRVGITLDEDLLAAAASEAAWSGSRISGRAVIDHVLQDGEDFELLVAGDIDSAEARTLDLLPLGFVSEGAGLAMRTSSGTRTPLEPRGWQHL